MVCLQSSKNNEGLLIFPSCLISMFQAFLMGLKLILVVVLAAATMIMMSDDVPGIRFVSSHLLFPFSLTTSLRSRLYYPHFVDEGTEAYRGFCTLAKGDTLRKWWNRFLILEFKPLLLDTFGKEIDSLEGSFHLSLMPIHSFSHCIFFFLFPGSFPCG